MCYVSFMHSLPDSVAKALCFRSVRPPRSTNRSLVRPNRSCYHDILWRAWATSMKLTGNTHQPPLITFSDTGGWRSLKSRSQQDAEFISYQHYISWITWFDSRSQRSEVSLKRFAVAVLYLKRLQEYQRSCILRNLSTGALMTREIPCRQTCSQIVCQFHWAVESRNHFTFFTSIFISFFFTTVLVAST